MRSAVSKSTWVPSTAADRMLRGAGMGAPLSVLRRLAGNAGSIAANAGVDGVPPGIRYFGWSQGCFQAVGLAGPRSRRGPCRASPRGSTPARRRSRPPGPSRACAAGPASSTLRKPFDDPEHAGDAGDAPAAGQQAQRDLGQPVDHARGVEADAVVAGEPDLQAAAERRAVHGRDDGLAERLQLAQLAPSRSVTGPARAARRPGPPSRGRRGRRPRRTSSWPR